MNTACSGCKRNMVNHINNMIHPWHKIWVTFVSDFISVVLLFAFCLLLMCPVVFFCQFCSVLFPWFVSILYYDKRQVGCMWVKTGCYPAIKMYAQSALWWLFGLADFVCFCLESQLSFTAGRQLMANVTWRRTHNVRGCFRFVTCLVFTDVVFVGLFLFVVVLLGCSCLLFCLLFCFVYHNFLSLQVTNFGWLMSKSWLDQLIT